MGEAEIRERRRSRAANAALDLRCHTATWETLPGSDGWLLGQGQRRSLPLAAASRELKNCFFLLSPAVSSGCFAHQVQKSAHDGCVFSVNREGEWSHQ